MNAHLVHQLQSFLLYVCYRRTRVPRLNSDHIGNTCDGEQRSDEATEAVARDILLQVTGTRQGDMRYLHTYRQLQ